MKVAAIVLAAGASSRLGEPKQLLLDHEGEALVHKVARDAYEAGCRPVYVVVGAEGARISAAVHDLNITIVENLEWSNGLSTSIRCGVAAAAHSKDRVEGALLLTCDMPSVGQPHIKLLLDSFNTTSRRVASSYGNTWGVPAIFPVEDFAALQSLDGDRGAKSVLVDDPSVSLLPLEGGTFDLDTHEDVKRWRASAGD